MCASNSPNRTSGSFSSQRTQSSWAQEPSLGNTTHAQIAKYPYHPFFNTITEHSDVRNVRSRAIETRRRPRYRSSGTASPRASKATLSSSSSIAIGAASKGAVQTLCARRVPIRLAGERRKFGGAAATKAFALGTIRCQLCKPVWYGSPPISRAHGSSSPVPVQSRPPIEAGTVYSVGLSGSTCFHPRLLESLNLHRVEKASGGCAVQTDMGDFTERF